MRKYRPIAMEPHFEAQVAAYMDGEEDYHVVTLKLVLSSGEVCMVPEDTSSINEIDTEAKSGMLDTSPGNGEFALSWGEKKIELSVARYGSGRGGSLCVSLQATPELLASLRAALRKWKDGVNNAGK